MSVYTMTRPEPRHDDHGWPSPPDPGDLSRRVAQRRAELHLSQAQLAARAGVSLRYVEYLERYPARPAPAALRQLAAALRTTPAALLGGAAPPARGRRGLAVARRRARGLRADRATRDHRPPHRAGACSMITTM